MTTICLIAAAPDAAAVETIREGLLAQGYAVWNEPATFGPETAAYALEVERGVRGSAAIVLIWSADTDSDPWVERKLLHAQQLRKPVLAVCRDTTALPSTLVGAHTLTIRDLDAGALQQIRAQLPPPEANDLLLALLGNDYIRERRRGIAEAAELLRRGERVEEMVALLTDLARNDQYDRVRDAARAALEGHQGAPPVTRAREVQYMQGVRCPNGHISYFDRRVLCRSQGINHRAIERAGKSLEEMFLTCTTCGEEVKVRIDCEGCR